MHVVAPFEPSLLLLTVTSWTRRLFGLSRLSFGKSYRLWQEILRLNRGNLLSLFELTFLFVIARSRVPQIRASVCLLIKANHSYSDISGGNFKDCRWILIGAGLEPVVTRGRGLVTRQQYVWLFGNADDCWVVGQRYGWIVYVLDHWGASRRSDSEPMLFGKGVELLSLWGVQARASYLKAIGHCYWHCLFSSY